MSETPVFMIVMLDVTDFDALMSDYAGPLQAHHAKHSVEVIVATPATTVLEGEYTKNLTVVLKFPSADAQKAWYEDPDYQPLLKRRWELTDRSNSIALVAPAFEAPS